MHTLQRYAAMLLCCAAGGVMAQQTKLCALLEQESKPLFPKGTEIVDAKLNGCAIGGEFSFDYVELFAHPIPEAPHLDTAKATRNDERELGEAAYSLTTNERVTFRFIRGGNAVTFAYVNFKQLAPSQISAARRVAQQIAAKL